MKFDLGRDDLEAVLSPWQVAVMRYVWEVGETDSRRAYEFMRGTEFAMSRASLINFLKRMVDESFLDYSEETGKGGHKGIWRPHPEALDERAFRQLVAERIRAKLLEFTGEA